VQALLNILGSRRARRACWIVGVALAIFLTPSCFSQQKTFWFSSPQAVRIWCENARVQSDWVGCTWYNAYTFQGNNTFTGANTFSGNLTATKPVQLGAIRYASGGVGADWCSQANSVDATIGSAPGKIIIDGNVASLTCAAVLTQSGPRIYEIQGLTLSAPLGDLVFTKPSLIDGLNRANTIINITGASGVAFTANWDSSTGGSYLDWYSGIQNLQLIGPGGLNGSGNAGTAIQVGGSNNGTIGVHVRNMIIAGFTLGETWAQSASWGTDTDNVAFFSDTVGPNINQAIEAAKFKDVVCGSIGAAYQTGCFQITANALNIQIDNLEMDAGQFTMSAGNVYCHKCHFENVATSPTVAYVIITGGNFTGSSDDFLLNGVAANNIPEFVDVNGGRYTQTGGSYFSTTKTVTQAVLLENAAEYHSYGTVNINLANFTNGLVAQAGTWTGIAEYDNGGQGATGPGRTLWASGTGVPFQRFQRGTASTTTIDLRTSSNWTANTFEITDGVGHTLFQGDGVNGQVRFPVNLIFQGNFYPNSGSVLFSSTAPTIAAAGCGGAAASIPVNNGTASFNINVGTTPTSACTVTMPTATNGWNCSAVDVTTNSTSVFLQKQSPAASQTTTQIVITNFNDVAVATAFVASDIVRVACSGN